MPARCELNGLKLIPSRWEKRGRKSSENSRARKLLAKRRKERETMAGCKTMAQSLKSIGKKSRTMQPEMLLLTFLWAPLLTSADCTSFQVFWFAVTTCAKRPSAVSRMFKLLTYTQIRSPLRVLHTAPASHATQAQLRVLAYEARHAHVLVQDLVPSKFSLMLKATAPALDRAHGLFKACPSCECYRVRLCKLVQAYKPASSEARCPQDC